MTIGFFYASILTTQYNLNSVHSHPFFGLNMKCNLYSNEASI